MKLLALGLQGFVVFIGEKIYRVRAVGLSGYPHERIEKRDQRLQAREDATLPVEDIDLFPAHEMDASAATNADTR